MQKIPRALSPAVLIPGLLFEALIRARNGLYSAGWIAQRRLPNPVISIGNLTTGGAGKTPLVIYVARALIKLGFIPAVLTRGYGRSNGRQSHILPPQGEVPSASETLGDEPALIRRHLPSVWMGISKNRYQAGCAIARRCTEAVFVLDDGFQHRRLHRDLDIVIIDPSQPLKSNHVFPRGTLREPLRGLRRCHAAVINSPTESKASESAEALVRDLQPHAKIFHCRQAIQQVIPFSSWKNGAGSGSQGAGVRSVYLVSALGNPERFRRDVLQLGIKVRGGRYFPDHYRPRLKDWISCADAARQSGADAILTTEKDAIKIPHPPDFPLLVSVQSAEMSEAKAFERILQNCAGGLT